MLLLELKKVTLLRDQKPKNWTSLNDNENKKDSMRAEKDDKTNTTTMGPSPVSRREDQMGRRPRLSYVCLNRFLSFLSFNVRPSRCATLLFLLRLRMLL